MAALQKYTPFFVSALLLWLLLFSIYPHYQYYIDPDGTAYLTICQRYAQGDYAAAINGYWSPWACWLTAMLIKAGMAVIPASVIINTLGATGFLYISHSFFLRFKIAKEFTWLLCITLAFFLCYAIFWQSFDDLWECFFLLCVLRIILAAKFNAKPGYWLLCGLLGALAYFAKAYSFPFFIACAFCCTKFVGRDNKNWLHIFFVFTAVMLCCSLPWMVALHHKYGIWTTSTAGSLNMSWYLVGHPHWKTGINLLVPPAYADSPYYWEDPYVANGITTHFWDSFPLFGRQLMRIGQNIMKLIVSMMQLSILFPFVFVAIIWYAISFIKRPVATLTNFSREVLVIAVSAALFLSGYLLINFESRYIWYLLPLVMAIGALRVQNTAGAKRRKILMVLFPITFSFVPRKPHGNNV